jgi:hypothetical protein
MNKIVFFNDTGKTVRIHPATLGSGVTVDLSPIPHLRLATFTLPENTMAWIKLWGDNTILVQPFSEPIRRE